MVKNDPAVELRLSRQAKAPSTRRTDRIGIVKFTAFCKQLHLQPCPASKHAATLFAAHQSKTFRIQTIKVYPAPISYLHHSNGFQSNVTRNPKPQGETRSQRGTGRLVWHCRKATTDHQEVIGVVPISVREQDTLYTTVSCCRQHWKRPSLG